MPEMPIKTSRAIIRKKARELRHNNFMGQGESVGNRSYAYSRSSVWKHPHSTVLNGVLTQRNKNLLLIKDFEILA